MLNKTSILRWIFIISIGIICMFGIGYLSPALMQNTAPTPSSETVTQQIAKWEKNFLKEKNLSHYDKHLANLIQKSLRAYLSSNEVTVIVKSDTILQQNEIIQTEILPDTGVVRSERIEQQENGAVIQDKIFDYSTKTTQKQQIFYDVKKLDLFVFLPKQSFDNHTSEQIEKLISSIAGFNAKRGDVLQIIFLSTPSLQQEKPFKYTLLIQQICALMLICFLCIFLFASLLVPWIIKNFYSKKSFQPLKEQAQHDLYHHQIVGHLEDNLILKAQALCSAMPEVALNVLRNYMSDEKQHPHQNDLFSPTQKVAIILLCMGEKIIKHLFRHMTDSEIFSLSRLMASLGHVKAIDIQPILFAFCQSMNTPQDIHQTQPLVENIIKNTLPVNKAEALLYDMKMASGGKSVWDKVNKIPTLQLSSFIANEYPQTAAIILYHLSAEKAAAVLAETDEQIGARILLRLSALQYMDPDNVKRIEINLEKQIEMLMAKPQNMGLQKASAILSLLDKKTQNLYMDTVENLAPQTALVLARRVLNFDDLAYWPDNDLRILIKHVDMETLIHALSNANQATKEAFSRVIPPRKWGDILKKADKTPLGKVQEIDASQRAVIQIAHQLIESKKCKGKTL